MKAAPKRARKAVADKKRSPKISGDHAEKSRRPNKAENSATRRGPGRPPLPPEVKAERARIREKKGLERSALNAEIVAVRFRYIQGYYHPDHPDGAPPVFESLRTIHSILGCKITLRTLESRSSEEGWLDQRLEFQAKAAARADLLIRRKLALSQAAFREEVHTGARDAAKKLIEAVNTKNLDVLDLSRTMTALDRGLTVTERAIDPSKGALQLGEGGGAKWVLLCSGLDPVEDADVLDVIPEEVED